MTDSERLGNENESDWQRCLRQSTCIAELEAELAAVKADRSTADELNGKLLAQLAALRTQNERLREAGRESPLAYAVMHADVDHAHYVFGTLEAAEDFVSCLDLPESGEPKIVPLVPEKEQQ